MRHNPSFHRLLVAAVLVGAASVASGWAASGTTTGGSVPPDVEFKALEIASGQTGVPGSELTVLASAPVVLTEQGITVYEVKVLHEAGEAVYQVTLDEDGNQYDMEALTQAEGDLYTSRYGALNKDFFDQLQKAPPGQIFPVVLWVREPFTDPTELFPDPESEPSEDELESAEADIDAARRESVQAAVAPVVSQLEAYGFLAEADELVPVIATKVPAQILLDDVSHWAEVLAIYDASQPYDPALEIQLPACQTNVVHNQGITGAGIRVAEVEVGGQINTTNPFLTPVTQDLTFSCLSNHSAAVAGIIRSTNTARLGHAYNCNLWIGGSCLGVVNEIINRSSVAAFSHNARTFNLSFGAPGAGGFLTTLDRYYDSLVLFGGRTVVPAAGNSFATGFVWSPGTAYNVVTVGSYDDRNTTFWPDDVMSIFSSTLNPFSLHGDRIKPEVAAPGSSLNSTTNTSPWTGAVGSGTSFAAPAVTGISALLMQRALFLQVWPESVKAILMASAEHNIEGATRLSNRDGAGGVVADRADRVARRVLTAGNWQALFYTCGNPFLQNLTTVNLTAGQRIRFAMAWPTNPNYWLYAWRPGADLDLWARTPTGGFAAFSVSWDNTYEIVDFTAPVSGPYTFQVYKYRCSTHPYRLGWAWHIVP
jgi:hypothetical protein